MRCIYLDTSAINCMYDYSNCSDIIKKLHKDNTIFISVFNIAEIAANSDKGKRRNLIKFSYNLLNDYHPIDLPHEFLKRSFIAYKIGLKKFSGSIESNKNWIMELLCEAPLDSEAYYNLTEYKNNEEKWYQDMHDNGRAKLQEILKKMPPLEKKRVTSSFSSFIKDMYQYRQDFLYDFIISYIRNNINEYEVKTKKEAQNILSHLEPWRFYLAGMGYGLYKRSIQETCYSKKRNPGSIDTQQAIYLAACDIFVTNDQDQYNMLRILVPFGRRKRKVVNCIQFCKQLLN